MKGFAHVDFAEPSACQNAVNMAGQMLDGRALNIDFAGAKKSGGFGGGGFGGGGFGGGGRGGGFGGGKQLWLYFLLIYSIFRQRRRSWRPWGQHLE